MFKLPPLKSPPLTTAPPPSLNKQSRSKIPQCEQPVSETDVKITILEYMQSLVIISRRCRFPTCLCELRCAASRKPIHLCTCTHVPLAAVATITHQMSRSHGTSTIQYCAVIHLAVLWPPMLSFQSQRQAYPTAAACVCSLLLAAPERAHALLCLPPSDPVRRATTKQINAMLSRTQTQCPRRWSGCCSCWA